MRSILLTGGSGFIGGHFHNYLPHDQLVNLDLEDPKSKVQSLFVKGDIRIEADVERAIKGSNIETIIALAAKHHDFGIGHQEYFDTNEDGTRVVCKVASANGIKNIIFYSSVAVYGMAQAISTELSEPRPESPYGASKLAGEKVLREWASEDERRSVLIIRPTVVYGENNVANMYSLIKQIDSGFYFHIGRADNVKSIAYVENLVNATLFLMNRMRPGFNVYNYADEPQLTSREIAEVIAAELGKKIKITLPLSIALILGFPFDLAIRITGKNLPISTARIKKLNTETRHSAAKIFKEGFKAQFTTIEGLKKMVAWFKK
jgi:nucleoside-diphosphate-sugar epimerase